MIDDEISYAIFSDPRGATFFRFAVSRYSGDAT